MRYFIVLAAFLFIYPAHAAEPVPGGACAAAGATIATAEGGGGHFMICESGTWKSVYSYNATGALTKLGNQSCAGGETLKFNGTTWACAADNAGSGGMTALTGDVTGSGSGSVAATIAANAVTSIKILDGTVSNADLAGSIALSKIAITGTPNGSKFLKDDGTWATPAGGGGVTTQTTVNCSYGADNSCTTGSCAAGYIRSGCSTKNSSSGYPGGQAAPSGTAACLCQGQYGGTCYTYCIK
jgi:hypothetical protein